ncbi:MAG: HemK2/MTQ2 family protein methyltransferase [Thermoproteota archaeon]
MGQGCDRNTHEIIVDELRLIIHPSVYPPSEDSYLLLDTVKKAEAKKILEVGCGCGLVSLTLARRNVEVVAVDIKREACRNTLTNLKLNRVQGAVHIVNGDLATALRRNIKFDMVVSNPPYLPVEVSPSEDSSWAAGEENSFSKKLLENMLPLLSANGVMFLVQSSLTDLEGLKKLVEAGGFSVEEASCRRFFFEKIVVLKIFRKPV